MADQVSAPRLPGALADRPRLSLSDRLRGRRLGMPWSVPDEMFHERAVPRKTILGPMVFLGHPALAKHVLIDNAANYPKAPLELKLFSALLGKGLLGIDGELWRTHRRTMAPAFDPRAVAGYAPAMSACVEAFVAQWADCPDGAALDVAEAMTELTLSIIARTMFHEADDRLETLIMETLRDMPQLNDFGLLDVLPLVSGLRGKARERRMADLFRPFDGAIGQMIARREAQVRAGEAPPDDLLSRLIAARDEATGAGLTAQEVRDEVVTIFLAGHETTATAMAWIWLLLALHPHERERLHHEVDAVLQGRTAQQADIEHLAFTRRVVDEALRLFPPAPGISARVAKADDVLDGQPVKAGTYMVMAPWVQQRHRAVWDEPERFDPDRFLPERAADRPRLAMMPFGAGPRVCIGQRLAETEIVLILATLAQHFTFEMASDAPVALRHNVTLRPRDGLPMRLRRRRPAPAAVAAE
jgi:cytochrome P450